MKKLIVFMFSVVLLGSCSSEKVLSERLKYDWNINYLENDDTNDSFISSEDYQYVKEHPKNSINNKLKSENLLASSKNIIIHNKKELISLSKKVRELSKLDGDCDNIIYKNGEEVSVKVIEITTDVVKFKRCDNLDGPLISVKKSKLLMIRYKNGSKEIFKDNSAELENKEIDKSKLKVQGLGLTSMIIGIIGGILPSFFVLIISSLLAIIFSSIAMAKIKKNPEKFKGKGFAITGLVLGIILAVWSSIFSILILLNF